MAGMFFSMSVQVLVPHEVDVLQSLVPHEVDALQSGFLAPRNFHRQGQWGRSFQIPMVGERMVLQVQEDIW